MAIGARQIEPVIIKTTQFINTISRDTPLPANYEKKFRALAQDTAAKALAWPRPLGTFARIVVEAIASHLQYAPLQGRRNHRGLGQLQPLFDQVRADIERWEEPEPGHILRGDPSWVTMCARSELPIKSLEALHALPRLQSYFMWYPFFSYSSHLTQFLRASLLWTSNRPIPALLHTLSAMRRGIHAQGNLPQYWGRGGLLMSPIGTHPRWQSGFGRASLWLTAQISILQVSWIANHRFRAVYLAPALHALASAVESFTAWASTQPLKAIPANFTSTLRAVVAYCRSVPPEGNAPRTKKKPAYPDAFYNAYIRPKGTTKKNHAKGTSKKEPRKQIIAIKSSDKRTLADMRGREPERGAKLANLLTDIRDRATYQGERIPKRRVLRARSTFLPACRLSQMLAPGERPDLQFNPPPRRRIIDHLNGLHVVPRWKWVVPSRRCCLGYLNFLPQNHLIDRIYDLHENREKLPNASTTRPTSKSSQLHTCDVTFPPKERKHSLSKLCGTYTVKKLPPPKSRISREKTVLEKLREVPLSNTNSQYMSPKNRLKHHYYHKRHLVQALAFSIVLLFAMDFAITTYWAIPKDPIPMSSDPTWVTRFLSVGPAEIAANATYTFWAANSCYMVISLGNAEYAKVSVGRVDEPDYFRQTFIASYAAENVWALEFPYTEWGQDGPWQENQPLYNLTIESDDRTGIEGISIQPLFIAYGYNVSVSREIIEGDMIEQEIVIPFKALGPVTLLIDTLMPISQLGVVLDGVTIKPSGQDLTEELDLPTRTIMNMLYKEGVARFEGNVGVGSHEFRVNGNGTFTYAVAAPYDFDNDEFDDITEIMAAWDDLGLHPEKPDIMGTFAKTETNMTLATWLEQGRPEIWLDESFMFNIPPAFSIQKNLLSICTASGQYKDFVIDEDDQLLKDVTLFGLSDDSYEPVEIIDKSGEIVRKPAREVVVRDEISVGEITTGKHQIQYKVLYHPLRESSIVFKINKDLIGVWDVQSVPPIGNDEDKDGLPDEYDESPLANLEIPPKTIFQIEIPYDNTFGGDLQLTMNVRPPENDHSTGDHYIRWPAEDPNGMTCAIIPGVRLWGPGNNSCPVGSAENPWDTLDQLAMYYGQEPSPEPGAAPTGSAWPVVEYNLVEYDSNGQKPNCHGECDMLPGSDPNATQKLIFAEQANNTWKFELGGWPFDSPALTYDAMLLIRFSVVWIVVEVKDNLTTDNARVVHYYDFESPCLIQSLSVNYIKDLDYCEGKPQSWPENEALFALVQNPAMGETGEFDWDAELINAIVVNGTSARLYPSYYLSKDDVSTWSLADRLPWELTAVDNVTFDGIGAIPPANGWQYHEIYPSSDVQVDWTRGLLLLKDNSAQDYASAAKIFGDFRKGIIEWNFSAEASQAAFAGFAHQGTFVWGVSIVNNILTVDGKAVCLVPTINGVIVACELDLDNRIISRVFINNHLVLQNITLDVIPDEWRITTVPTGIGCVYVDYVTFCRQKITSLDAHVSYQASTIKTIDILHKIDFGIRYNMQALQEYMVYPGNPFGGITFYEGGETCPINGLSGWMDLSETGAIARVQDTPVHTHDNILRLQPSGGNIAEVQRTPADFSVPNGSVQWWFLKQTDAGILDICLTDDVGVVGPWIRFTGSEILFRNATTDAFEHVGGPWDAQIWPEEFFYGSIEFNCTSFTFDLLIQGASRDCSVSIPFYNNITAIRSIILKSSDGSGITYIDGPSCSWGYGYCDYLEMFISYEEIKGQDTTKRLAYYCVINQYNGTKSLSDSALKGSECIIAKSCFTSAIHERECLIISELPIAARLIRADESEEDNFEMCDVLAITRVTTPSFNVGGISSLHNINWRPSYLPIPGSFLSIYRLQSPIWEEVLEESKIPEVNYDPVRGDQQTIVLDIRDAAIHYWANLFTNPFSTEQSNLPNFAGPRTAPSFLFTGESIFEAMQRIYSQTFLLLHSCASALQDVYNLLGLVSTEKVFQSGWFEDTPSFTASRGFAWSYTDSRYVPMTTLLDAGIVDLGNGYTIRSGPNTETLFIRKIWDVHEIHSAIYQWMIAAGFRESAHETGFRLAWNLKIGDEVKLNTHVQIIPEKWGQWIQGVGTGPQEPTLNYIIDGEGRSFQQFMMDTKVPGTKLSYWEVYGAPSGRWTGIAPLAGDLVPIMIRALGEGMFKILDDELSVDWGDPIKKDIGTKSISHKITDRRELAYIKAVLFERMGIGRRIEGPVNRNPNNAWSHYVQWEEPSYLELQRVPVDWVKEDLTRTGLSTKDPDVRILKIGDKNYRGKLEYDGSIAYFRFDETIIFPDRPGHVLGASQNAYKWGNDLIEGGVHLLLVLHSYFGELERFFIHSDIDPFTGNPNPGTTAERAVRWRYTSAGLLQQAFAITDPIWTSRGWKATFEPVGRLARNMMDAAEGLGYPAGFPAPAFKWKDKSGRWASVEGRIIFARNSPNILIQLYGLCCQIVGGASRSDLSRMPVRNTAFNFDFDDLCAKTREISIALKLKYDESGVWDQPIRLYSSRKGHISPDVRKERSVWYSSKDMGFYFPLPLQSAIEKIAQVWMKNFENDLPAFRSWFTEFVQGNLEFRNFIISEGIDVAGDLTNVNDARLLFQTFMKFLFQEFKFVHMTGEASKPWYYVGTLIQEPTFGAMFYDVNELEQVYHLILQNGWYGEETPELRGVLNYLTLQFGQKETVVSRQYRRALANINFRFAVRSVMIGASIGGAIALIAGSTQAFAISEMNLAVIGQTASSLLTNSYLIPGLLIGAGVVTAGLLIYGGIKRLEGIYQEHLEVQKMRQITREGAYWDLVGSGGEGWPAEYRELPAWYGFLAKRESDLNYRTSRSMSKYHSEYADKKFLADEYDDTMRVLATYLEEIRTASFRHQNVMMSQEEWEAYNLMTEEGQAEFRREKVLEKYQKFAPIDSALASILTTGKMVWGIVDKFQTNHPYARDFTVIMGMFTAQQWARTAMVWSARDSMVEAISYNPRLLSSLTGYGQAVFMDIIFSMFDMQYCTDVLRRAGYDGNALLYVLDRFIPPILMELSLDVVVDTITMIINYVFTEAGAVLSTNIVTLVIGIAISMLMSWAWGQWWDARAKQLPNQVSYKVEKQWIDFPQALLRHGGPEVGDYAEYGMTFWNNGSNGFWLAQRGLFAPNSAEDSLEGVVGRYPLAGETAYAFTQSRNIRGMNYEWVNMFGSVPPSFTVPNNDFMGTVSTPNWANLIAYNSPDSYWQATNYGDCDYDYYSPPMQRRGEIFEGLPWAGANYGGWDAWGYLLDSKVRAYKYWPAERTFPTNEDEHDFDGIAGESADWDTFVLRNGLDYATPELTLYLETDFNYVHLDPAYFFDTDQKRETALAPRGFPQVQKIVLGDENRNGMIDPWEWAVRVLEPEIDDFLAHCVNVTKPTTLVEELTRNYSTALDKFQYNTAGEYVDRLIQLIESQALMSRNELQELNASLVDLGAIDAPAGYTALDHEYKLAYNNFPSVVSENYYLLPVTSPAAWTEFLGSPEYHPLWTAGWRAPEAQAGTLYHQTLNDDANYSYLTSLGWGVHCGDGNCKVNVTSGALELQDNSDPYGTEVMREIGDFYQGEISWDMSLWWLEEGWNFWSTNDWHTRGYTFEAGIGRAEDWHSAYQDLISIKLDWNPPDHSTEHLFDPVSANIYCNGEVAGTFSMEIGTGLSPDVYRHSIGVFDAGVKMDPMHISLKIDSMRHEAELWINGQQIKSVSFKLPLVPNQFRASTGASQGGGWWNGYSGLIDAFTIKCTNEQSASLNAFSHTAYPENPTEKGRLFNREWDACSNGLLLVPRSWVTQAFNYYALADAYRDKLAQLPIRTDIHPHFSWQGTISFLPGTSFAGSMTFTYVGVDNPLVRYELKGPDEFGFTPIVGTKHLLDLHNIPFVLEAPPAISAGTYSFTLTETIIEGPFAGNVTYFTRIPVHIAYNKSVAISFDALPETLEFDMAYHWGTIRNNGSVPAWVDITHDGLYAGENWLYADGFETLARWDFTGTSSGWYAATSAGRMLLHTDSITFYGTGGQASFRRAFEATLAPGTRVSIAYNSTCPSAPTLHIGETLLLAGTGNQVREFTISDFQRLNNVSITGDFSSGLLEVDYITIERALDRNVPLMDQLYPSDTPHLDLYGWTESFGSGSDVMSFREEITNAGRVDATAPAWNFGTSEWLHVGGTGTDPVYASYIEIPDTPSELQMYNNFSGISVYLYLYHAYSGADGSTEIFISNCSSFNEQSLCWDSRPKVSGAWLDDEVIDRDLTSWVCFDITGMTGKYLCINATGENTASFMSDDAGALYTPYVVWVVHKGGVGAGCLQVQSDEIVPESFSLRYDLSADFPNVTVAAGDKLWVGYYIECARPVEIIANETFVLAPTGGTYAIHELTFSRAWNITNLQVRGAIMAGENVSIEYIGLRRLQPWGSLFKPANITGWYNQTVVWEQDTAGFAPIYSLAFDDTNGFAWELDPSQSTFAAILPVTAVTYVDSDAPVTHYGDEANALVMQTDDVASRVSAAYFQAPGASYVPVTNAQFSLSLFVQACSGVDPLQFRRIGGDLSESYLCWENASNGVQLGEVTPQMGWWTLDQNISIGQQYALWPAGVGSTSFYADDCPVTEIRPYATYTYPKVGGYQGTLVLQTDRPVNELIEASTEGVALDVQPGYRLRVRYIANESVTILAKDAFGGLVQTFQLPATDCWQEITRDFTLESAVTIDAWVIDAVLHDGQHVMLDYLVVEHPAGVVPQEFAAGRRSVVQLGGIGSTLGSIEYRFASQEVSGFDWWLSLPGTNCTCTISLLDPAGTEVLTLDYADWTLSGPNGTEVITLGSLLGGNHHFSLSWDVGLGNYTLLHNNQSMVFLNYSDGSGVLNLPTTIAGIAGIRFSVAPARLTPFWLDGLAGHWVAGYVPASNFAPLVIGGTSTSLLLGPGVSYELNLVAPPRVWGTLPGERDFCAAIYNGQTGSLLATATQKLSIPEFYDTTFVNISKVNFVGEPGDSFTTHLNLTNEGNVLQEYSLDLEGTQDFFAMSWTGTGVQFDGIDDYWVQLGPGTSVELTLTLSEIGSGTEIYNITAMSPFTTTKLPCFISTNYAPVWAAIPTDLAYVVGEGGAPGSRTYLLTWRAFDDTITPARASYEITCNGLVVANSTWASGTDITFDVSGLGQIGTFVYKIEVNDGRWAYITDNVSVVVYNDNPQVSHPDDLFFVYDHPPNNPEWMVFDTQAVDPLYDLTLDGVPLVTHGTWTPYLEAGEVITVDVADFLPRDTSYQLELTLWDGDISNAVTDTVLVTVMNTPLVFTSEPAPLDRVVGWGGSVHLTWSIWDESVLKIPQGSLTKHYVDWVTFVDGILYTSGIAELMDDCGTIGFTFNAVGFSLGAHEVSLQVDDRLGSMCSVQASSITVLVSNYDPIIAISPANLEYELNSAAPHALSWTVLDDTKDVAHYEVYLNDSLHTYAGWTSGVPIVVDVSGLPRGTYMTVLKLWDGLGRVVESNPVIVKVYNAPPSVLNVYWNMETWTAGPHDNDPVLSLRCSDNSVNGAGGSVRLFRFGPLDDPVEGFEVHLPSNNPLLQGQEWMGAKNINFFPGSIPSFLVVGDYRFCWIIDDGLGVTNEGEESIVKVNVPVTFHVTNALPDVVLASDITYLRGTPGHTLTWTISDYSVATPSSQYGVDVVIQGRPYYYNYKIIRKSDPLNPLCYGNLESPDGSTYSWTISINVDGFEGYNSPINPTRQEFELQVSDGYTPLTAYVPTVCLATGDNFAYDNQPVADDAYTKMAGCGWFLDANEGTIRAGGGSLYFDLPGGLGGDDWWGGGCFAPHVELLCGDVEGAFGTSNLIYDVYIPDATKMPGTTQAGFYLAIPDDHYTKWVWFFGVGDTGNRFIKSAVIEQIDTQVGYHDTDSPVLSSVPTRLRMVERYSDGTDIFSCYYYYNGAWNLAGYMQKSHTYPGIRIGLYAKQWGLISGFQTYTFDYLNIYPYQL